MRLVPDLTLVDVDTFLATVHRTTGSDDLTGELVLVAAGVPVWEQPLGTFALGVQEQTDDLLEVLTHAAVVELDFLGLKPAPAAGDHPVAVSDNEYNAVYCAPCRPARTRSWAPGARR